jgi:hypothetical protein
VLLQFVGGESFAFDRGGIDYGRRLIKNEWIISGRPRSGVHLGTRRIKEDRAMQRDRQLGTRAFAVPAGFIVALGLLSATVFANKEAKSYPEEGKIVATGLSEWVVNNKHQHAHTYTVVTKERSYLLECGHKPVFGSMGEECGGSKKLQIGDVIHFRIEKDRAYIPITKSDNSAGEEKLQILSTTLKPDAPADKPQAAPEKNETKPPAP